MPRGRLSCGALLRSSATALPPMVKVGLVKYEYTPSGLFSGELKLLCRLTCGLDASETSPVSGRSLCPAHYDVSIWKFVAVNLADTRVAQHLADTTFIP